MLDEFVGKNIIDESIQSLEEKNKLINAVIRKQLVKGSEDGKYYGIPFLVKDNMEVEGTVTSCCSKILENHVSTYTATAVQKLLDQGFSIIGKTNMDEFAMGGANENSIYGPVRNPHDHQRVSGGSSGGSAGSVAAGIAPFALGSDTGGSIREPASFCGIVGYKPSYGMISRYGLIAFGSSLDQIGVLSRSVYDSAKVVDMMKGKDKKDSTSIDYKKDLTARFGRKLEGLRVAVPDIVFSQEIPQEIKEAFSSSLELLKKCGATVIPVSIPELKYVVSVYYIIAPAEASSNLSRFDGVRYGLRNEKDNLIDTYMSTRQDGFGAEVKRRIMMGTFTLSSAYYDAYFSKASKVRRVITEKINKVFEDSDVFFMPTSPALPPKVGEKLSILSYYLLDMFTIPANLAGLPAISVPYCKIGNLPFGVQFMGKRFMDDEMLAVADAFEKEVKCNV